MSENTRILRLSAVLKVACEAALLLLPLGALWALVSGALGEDRLRAAFPSLQMPAEIPGYAWLIVTAIGLMTLGALLAILWQMRGLFDHYAKADILGHAPARHILRIGQLTFALAVIGILGNTLSILALTSGNPPGERALAIEFGSNDLFLLFAAGLLTVIGWVLSAAADVADENARFV